MSACASPPQRLAIGLVWLLSAGWCIAQDQTGEAFLDPRFPSPQGEESAWLEDAADPSLSRLLPTDGPWIEEDPPPLESRRGDLRDGGAPGGSDRAPFTSRLSWIPPRNVKGQPADLAMNDVEFKLAFPVRIDPDGIWLAMSSLQRLEINTTSVLPDSGRAFPTQLWDIEVGVMHLRNWDNGWRAGGMLRVGSPSDRPFAALRDMTVSFLSFLTVPRGERDAWSFSLFYSPTGQIVYPIPGIAYLWRPNSQFQANLGIPFSIEYRPTDTLTLTASYMPLTNAKVIVRRSVGESWSIYGGYETVSEAFLLADRVNDRERTYLFDQRLTLGAQRELVRGWKLDLSVAYVFDRQIFQAEKFSGNRRDELAIDPGVAGTAQLIWTR